MFVETRSGFVNVSEIVSVDGERATLRNGDRVLLYGVTEDDIRYWGSTIVPATPGFEELRAYHHESEQPWVEREAIIAWRLVPGSAFIDTITIQPSGDNIYSTVVKYPNGQVVEIGGCCWESEEEWRSELPGMLVKHLELLARVAAKKAVA